MVRAPWIGIEVAQAWSGQVSANVGVVEVYPPTEESGWDGIVAPLVSAGHRILFDLDPISPDEVLGVFDAVCERYGGDGSLEGVVLSLAEEGDESVSGYLGDLSGKVDISKVYVRIDTDVAMDGYPELLGVLRAVCDCGATPYIVRPSGAAYADSFLHTRYFTAAARLRRSPFVLSATSESASPGNAVSAVFETVASGASGLVLSAAFFDDTETANALASAEVHLATTEPAPVTAMLWPSPFDLADEKTADLFHDLAVSIRDITDYDVLDERRVCETCLANYQVVILPAGCCFEKDALDTVYDWVKRGGVLLSNCVGKVRCPDGETTFNRDLLDRELAAPNPAACCTMRRIFDGAAFHYCHDVACTQHKGISEKDGFVRMVARVLRRNVLLGAEKIEPDGLLDGIHAARLRDRILLLNATDGVVRQEILLPSDLGTREVDLPPFEITALALDDLMGDRV